MNSVAGGRAAPDPPIDLRPRVWFNPELESRNCPVVIDLARAKFLPSLALGLLVNLKRKLDERNSHMVITGLAPNIRRALSLSSLDRVFHLADSMDQLTPEQMAAR